MGRGSAGSCAGANSNMVRIGTSGKYIWTIALFTSFERSPAGTISRCTVADAFVWQPKLTHLHVKSTCNAGDRQQQSSTFRIALSSEKPNIGRSTKDIEEDNVFYNDDAFGLIFLSASLATRDFGFAAAFLLLSAAAAAAVSVNAFTFHPVVPGVVAFAALALSKLEIVSSAAQTFGGDFVMPLDENGRNVELGVCSISLIWGILQHICSSSNES